MRSDTCDALVEFLSRYATLVEIGIGRQTTLASLLGELGIRVIAIDLYSQQVPSSIEFVIDDITKPTISVYDEADAFYALNLPYELHRPARDVARHVGANFHFTTLGNERPAVPVEQTALPNGILYTAK